MGFHANAQPDLRRPGQLVVEQRHAFRAFGQYLVAMPIGLLHHGENLADEIIANPIVKQVAHGVDKNSAGLAPAQRNVQGIGMDGHVKAVAVLGHTGRVEALGHPLGVAMLAAGADLVAAGDGIPGGVRPLNFAGGHDAT